MTLGKTGGPVGFVVPAPGGCGRFADGEAGGVDGAANAIESSSAGSGGVSGTPIDGRTAPGGIRSEGFATTGVEVSAVRPACEANVPGSVGPEVLKSEAAGASSRAANPAANAETPPVVPAWEPPGDDKPGDEKPGDVTLTNDPDAGRSFGDPVCVPPPGVADGAAAVARKIMA